MSRRAVDGAVPGGDGARPLRVEGCKVEDDHRRALLAERTAAVITRRAQHLGPLVIVAARYATEAWREVETCRRQLYGVFALAEGGLACSPPLALMVAGDWLRQEGHLAAMHGQPLALQAEARAATEGDAEQLQWLEEFAGLPLWMAGHFRRRLDLRLLELASRAP